jgi:hypothetical protein
MELWLVDVFDPILVVSAVALFNVQPQLAHTTVQAQLWIGYRVH